METISQADGLDFEMTGQLVTTNIQQWTGMSLFSTSGAIQNSLFKIGSTAAFSGTEVPMGWIDFAVSAEQYPIQNNVILLRELLGGQYGLMIRSAQGQLFV